MQVSSFKQHSRCTVHRVAEQAFLSPDKPVQECLPYSLAKQDLFKGNVPQPQDWLRAWRACRTAASFKAALAFFNTEDFIQGSRSKVQHNSSLAAQVLAPTSFLLKMIYGN